MAERGFFVGRVFTSFSGTLPSNIKKDYETLVLLLFYRGFWDKMEKSISRDIINLKENKYG